MYKQHSSARRHTQCIAASCPIPSNSASFLLNRSPFGHVVRACPPMLAYPSLGVRSMLTSAACDLESLLSCAAACDLDFGCNTGSSTCRFQCMCTHHICCKGDAYTAICYVPPASRAHKWARVGTCELCNLQLEPSAHRITGKQNYCKGESNVTRSVLKA